MKHDHLLSSENLNMLPLDEKSSELYRMLRNKEENRKFFFTDTEITPEQQALWLKKYYEDETQYMFAIYEKHEGVFIGGISIYDIDGVLKAAEIGRIIIDREYSGRNYGAEAISLLKEFGFSELGLNRLYANIYENNIPSQKAFCRAGFIQNGTKSGVVSVSIEKDW